MRDTFLGWYPRSQEELSVLWDNAIFVPDTNILLHCLRHSAQVREELLRILEMLRDSLWIPYQVGLEFHRHRLDVEWAAAGAYDRLVSEYEGALGQAREKLKQLRAHPEISVEGELSALDMFESDFRARMETAKARHPAQALAAALERITAIFEKRVGAKPASEKLTAIRKEGEERYAKRIPPGYKDAKKDGADIDKFGDLIIWKDLIEKAKTDKRPLIFVSDDVKEDWWYTHRGKKLGPRPELLDEFRANAGQDFHIYELGQFLRIAAERHKEIPQASIEQIERSVQDDETAYRRSVSALQKIEQSARIWTLEDERDAIIAKLAGIPDLHTIRLGGTVDKAALQMRLVALEDQLATIRASQEQPPEGAP